MASGADLRFDGTVQPAGTGMETTPTPPTTPTPVVIWVLPYGIEEYEAGRNHTNVDSEYPTPILSYLAYGYAVISASYASQASMGKDLRLLIAYLKAHADDLVIDTDTIGVVTATRTGYTASIPVRAGKAGNVADLAVGAAKDTDYQALIYDPLTMTTPDVVWIDPCIHTSELGAYRVFPTPSRGQGSYASYAVYLPDAYAEKPHQRFPVIYFLHGGNGNQREAKHWLMTQVDNLIKAGELPPTIVVCAQGLSIGWYVNARETVDGVLSGPVEDVIVMDLIPHIDASYRTIARCEGRGTEG
ncbi:alpha/beta hydrolase-fold protein [Streptomyces sp. CA-210063]|uniref:alpha/beta hydrolase-fold protein n=1 Tax=Streptomyces sp. CA-210063 TaxID=2801029 RepID=UPI00214AC50F|nr:alpha/beta hydrolase-fold protein [Streptomyces sp. CA-210063]UUU29435.1 alpha/beta hydrolase-fold protein [Streptomyces sp. CA-210063]